LIKFFMHFHSKFEMPIYMKVVSLDKLDNFIKCLSEFWRTRQKFRKTSRLLGFEWGLTKSLTMGWPHMCVH
jgi:hypothetical protein